MRPDTVVLGDTVLLAAWGMMVSGLGAPTNDFPRDLRWGGDIPMGQAVVSVLPRGAIQTHEYIKENEPIRPGSPDGPLAQNTYHTAPGVSGLRNGGRNPEEWAVSEIEGDAPRGSGNFQHSRGNR